MLRPTKRWIVWLIVDLRIPYRQHCMHRALTDHLKSLIDRSFTIDLLGRRGIPTSRYSSETQSFGTTSDPVATEGNTYPCAAGLSESAGHVPPTPGADGTRR